MTDIVSKRFKGPFDITVMVIIIENHSETLEDSVDLKIQ